MKNAEQKRSINLTDAGQIGMADEAAAPAELLLKEQEGIYYRCRLLIEGGATASYFRGPLKPKE